MQTAKQLTNQAQSAPLYPFSALVGQEEMQLSLLLNAINPAIGGVLIRGEKGTAKSTAARGLAALLSVDQIADFYIESHTTEGVQRVTTEAVRRGSPFVELPIGATDDRVVGTLDIERALQSGQRHFEPGLLARADGGVLYVDEVNLLADHIVDILLDAAASGINQVEREGVSVTHPARFILIGTMNPEEGELRPQLLDRFGLTVNVVGPTDPTVRAEVVRRRFAYEMNPTGFAQQYTEQDSRLAQQIADAKRLLPDVVLSDGLLELITQICVGSAVDGLRADITLYKTALTLAAWQGQEAVTVDDIRQAAQFVLPHRRRRQPFEEPGLDQQQLEEMIQQHAPRQPQNRESDGRDLDDGSMEGE